VREADRDLRKPERTCGQDLTLTTVFDVIIAPSTRSKGGTMIDIDRAFIAVGLLWAVAGMLLGL
jgi:hypothetical protein